MKLILARHAQSEKNVGLGKNNSNNLTEIGLLEAKQLGNFLLSTPLDAIYLSPAERSQQTADSVLADRAGDSVPIIFSSLLSPKKKTETDIQLEKRVKLFLSDLLLDHKNSETILLISHSRPLSAILKHLLQQDHRLDHASITILDFTEKNSKLTTLNQTSHLT